MTSCLLSLLRMGFWPQICCSTPCLAMICPSFPVFTLQPSEVVGAEIFLFKPGAAALGLLIPPVTGLFKVSLPSPWLHLLERGNWRATGGPMRGASHLILEVMWGLWELCPRDEDLLEMNSVILWFITRNIY